MWGASGKGETKTNQLFDTLLLLNTRLEIADSVKVEATLNTDCLKLNAFIKSRLSIKSNLIDDITTDVPLGCGDAGASVVRAIRTGRSSTTITAITEDEPPSHGLWRRGWRQTICARDRL